jgi:dinuclear metal center YbgI/SA1388 family protein
MLLRELVQLFEEVAPSSLQESYDNAGLIVGDQDTEVKSALLCLDSTEEIIDEAIEKNCDLVIAHHPIVFGGLKKFNNKNYVERAVMKAIKHDIAIFAAHTNLDSVLQNGVNSKICQKIGIQDPSILSPKADILFKISTFIPKEKTEEVREAMFSSGGGHIGDYSHCSFNVEGIGTFKGGSDSDPFVGTPGELHNEGEVKVEMIVPAFLINSVVGRLKEVHPYEEVAYDVYPLKNKHDKIGMGAIGELEKELTEEEFLAHLKQAMNLELIKYTPSGKSIKKVAVCGGSGSFLLSDAMRAKADAFITSDFKYHQYFDSESRIVIADIGHYESEIFTLEIFSDIIKEKFPTFAVLFTERNTNPIKYYK